MIRTAPLTSLLLLCACASSPQTNAADTRLAEAMEGIYVRPASPEAEPLHDMRMRIDPLGPGEWLYYQVNEGEDLSEVYRQRVLQLRAAGPGRVVQTAYTVAQPERFAGTTRRFDTLSREDLDPALGGGCEMIWTRSGAVWSGRVDPDRCTIVSRRRGTELRIGARAELTQDGLRQAETGYRIDGTFLWGSQDGEWLSLRRED
ncbi:MAG: chromophore lyase CpcT/CpeT [Litorimonas sp.]